MSAASKATAQRKKGGANLYGSIRLLVICALFVALPASARADDALDCEVVADQGLICDVDATAQFDETLRDVLESGFTNNLVYRVYLFRVGDEEPAAIAVVSFAEVFRLYTDVYYISQEGTEGYIARYAWDAAVPELSRFSIRLGSPERLGEGEFFSAVILEVNPMSEDRLQEARRWIASSRDEYQLFGEGDRSFFGTFVSLFVNADEANAEVRRTFSSEPFEVSL